MARKKKNDFWDDVDETRVVVNDSPEDPAPAAEEDWPAVKSTPIKVLMRLLLMISCLVALAAGYICYEYVRDRYTEGSYSDDFYSSRSFADEYNNRVDQLLNLVSAMEADSSVTDTGNEQLLSTLVENYMGKGTNFSFIIQDQDLFELASSGDDAQDRIEASHHYVKLTYADGKLEVESTLRGDLLDKAGWKKSFSADKGSYIIYTAVDDELTAKDGFYSARQNFDKMGSYFGKARIVGIIAAIAFIICLIFCIIATGQVRGYDGIKLSWFDYVFTELALVIMVAVAAGLIYAFRYVRTMDGTMYQYASYGLIVLIYIWIARSYFSIVRRIKTGRFLRKSLIGIIIHGVSHAVGSLPFPLNAIIGAIILIIINGGTVYGLIFWRQYEFQKIPFIKGIPIMYIAAPAVFIIELLALLVHNIDKGRAAEDAELPPDEEEESAAGQEAAPAGGEADQTKVFSAVNPDLETDTDDSRAVPDLELDAAQDEGEQEQEWESMDLSEVISSARRQQEQSPDAASAEEAQQPAQQEISAQPEASVQAETGPQAAAEEEAPAQRLQSKAAAEVQSSTVVISSKDMEQALRDSGIVPLDEDFGGSRSAGKQEAEASAEAGQAEQPAAQEQSAEAAPAPEAAARVNFVQLNKDIRKRFRADLKSRGIIVTVRAPEKPVLVDLDEEQLRQIITNIFEQIKRLSADNVRNYLETYVQGGKVVYIAKIETAADKAQEAGAAVQDDSFQTARSLVEAAGGRFVVVHDGSLMKVGALMNAAK